MGTVLLVLVIVLVVAALVFGVASMLTGDDPGLSPVDPDGRALPLPNNRSLAETDLKTVRFDVTIRGYRMSQVDRVLRRTAYDIGYKDEMIAVLEAEVTALRDGRMEDADLLRNAREAAANPSLAPVETLPDAEADSTDLTVAGEDAVAEDTLGDELVADAPDELDAPDEPDAPDGLDAPDDAGEAAGPDTESGDTVARGTEQAAERARG